MKLEPRVNVLGVGITPTNLSEATASIVSAVSQPGFQGYVTVTGVHGVMESQKDCGLKKIHNQSFKSVPDGMPMVWLGKYDGFTDMDRVYGPDLMLKIVELSAQNGQTHFLFGSGPGVVDKLAAKLECKFPGATFTGKVTPPFRPLNDEEEFQLVETLERVKPNFFWVGLSTPKQERFMADFCGKYPRLTANWDHGMVMLGVGAAFDFHAGLVPQAPSWMQKRGLEWFFRLIKEPKRLWRRYLYNNPRFIVAAILQKTGITQHPLLR